VHGGVGEQADAVDSEVGEDLATQADCANDASMTVFVLLKGAELLVMQEYRRICRTVDFKATTGVVEVDDGSASGFCDHAHGLVESLAALAIRGEYIARGASCVNAHQHGTAAGGAVALVAAKGAVDERDVAFSAVDFTLVGDHAEVAVAGVDRAFARTGDVSLILKAIADEFGDCEHFKGVLATELDEVGDAGHGAVVLHDFTDDAGGVEPREAGKIDGRLGLAGSDEDSALASAQGKDVSGAGEVGGS